MAEMNLRMSPAAADLAKTIRMFNFFRDSGMCGLEEIAFIMGQIRALGEHKVISQSEKHYLWVLLKAGTDAIPDFEIEHWEGCIARPGYYPYENSLEEIAKKELTGVPVSSLDGRPDGAYSCSAAGISFHKFGHYAENIEICEMKNPLDPLEKTMKLIRVDDKADSEWYAADIAIAITAVFIRAQLYPAVLAFMCERGDLLPEHVLEGARRAQKFDEEFPATWNEKEHDYRWMHPGEPFVLDFHWLVIVKNGNEEIVREPLLDPRDME